MIIHTCANLRTVIMTILLILLEYFIIQKNIYIGLEVTVYHLQVSHIVAIIVLTNCKKKRHNNVVKETFTKECDKCHKRVCMPM